MTKSNPLRHNLFLAGQTHYERNQFEDAVDGFYF